MGNSVLNTRRRQAQFQTETIAVLADLILEARQALLDLGVDPDRDMAQWETRLRDIDPE